MIPISIDERRFTIWEWLGFLGLFILLVPFFALFTGMMFAEIWGNVWVGDFTGTDLIWACFGSIAGSAWLAILWFLPLLSLTDEPFVHGSVLVDTRANRLILRWRHITGLSFRKSLALADIRDLNVARMKSDDGKDIPHLRLIPAGWPFHPVITNPADAADLPAFAARLRAQLASAGWSDGSACGCPQGEAGSDRC